jgi:hypothetical protein
MLRSQQPHAQSSIRFPHRRPRRPPKNSPTQVIAKAAIEIIAERSLSAAYDFRSDHSLLAKGLLADIYVRILDQHLIVPILKLRLSMKSLLMQI